MNGKPDIVDMHCDTISRLLEKRNTQGTESLRRNSGHLDLLRLRDSGYLLQNFALFVNQGTCEDPWEQVMALLSLYEEELRQNEDLAAPVLSFEDIAENQARGRISSLLTVEEGGVCKGELGRLHTLYEKGVRMVTLTWNYPNELGYPNLDGQKGRKVLRTPDTVLSYLNTPDTVNGLTETGRIFVAEMERLGMIPDVSHLSDAGFYDVLSCTGKPFAASHSNARALCPCVRNLTDEMIRALGERGGVMGLNFCSDFLVQKPAGVKNPGTIEDIVRHARHIANTGGIEVLGLGSDFDGIDTHEELQGAQGMETLYEALVRGGFKPADVDKIFSENVLRVYRDTLSV